MLSNSSNQHTASSENAVLAAADLENIVHDLVHDSHTAVGKDEQTSHTPAPHATLEEQLWLNLARTASAAGHGVEVGLRPYGLSPTQLYVLHILRDAGAEGLCQYQIGERLVAQVPDVPRILDRMERAGWVQRERGTADRRLVMAKLTGRGLELAANVDGILEQLTSRMFSRLSRSEIGQLNELLTVARDTASMIVDDLSVESVSQEN